MRDAVILSTACYLLGCYGGLLLLLLSQLLLPLHESDGWLSCSMRLLLLILLVLPCYELVEIRVVLWGPILIIEGR